MTDAHADRSKAQGPGWWKHTDDLWYGPDETTPDGSTAPWKQQPAPRRNAVVWIVAGVLGVGIMVLILGRAGDEASTSVKSYEAESICEQFIDDRLKAPASADYTFTATIESAGTWTARGHVDAENGFGAQIRSEFRCKVTPDDGTDRWRLEDLQLS
jgi:hypothetical protein